MNIQNVLYTSPAKMTNGVWSIYKIIEQEMNQEMKQTIRYSYNFTQYSDSSRKLPFQLSEAKKNIYKKCTNWKDLHLSDFENWECSKDNVEFHPVKLSVNGANTTINWKCFSTPRFIGHIPFVSSVRKAPRWFNKVFGKPAVMVIYCLRLSFVHSTFSLRSTWWLLTHLVNFVMKSNRADAWKRNKPFP